MGMGTVILQPTIGHSPPQASMPLPPQQEAFYAASAAEPPAPPPSNARYEQQDDYYYPQRVPMGIFLLDKLINGTRGSLTIDLKRPQIPRAARTSLFTVNRQQPQVQAESLRGTTTRSAYGTSPQFRARGRMPPPQPEPRRQFIDYASLPSVSFANTGARIKAMRHIQFGSQFTTTKHGCTITAPQFDLAAGGNFEFDTAIFQPLLRLKFRDLASLQVLPYPAIKFQRRVQLGTSGFGVRMSYECPLETINQFYRPPARLLVTLDDTVDTGIRITQNGLELRANQWLFNGNARIQGSGMVQFPSELPIDEDQMLLRFEAKRLGFKTKW